MQIACIVGTDTEIGKTHSCCKIMEYLGKDKQPITTIKPIASGVDATEYGELNSDVYRLLKSNTHPLSSKKMNMFCFKQPIAPHIAAKMDNVKLNSQLVYSKTKSIIDKKLLVSHLLIEGIGGLMVPLNDKETYLDLLKKWSHPVIVVVGMKLGCLNHTLLTVNTLKQHNIPLVGFIANQIDPNMLSYDENLNYLTNNLDVPCLGTIPFNGSFQPTQIFKEFFTCK